jgi:hypothetical protein
MDVDPDGATWRKSSYSNGTGGNCVEVADLPSGRAVRDSKHPEGPILLFTREGWQAFVQGIQAGELWALSLSRGKRRSPPWSAVVLVVSAVLAGICPTQDAVSPGQRG